MGQNKKWLLYAFITTITWGIWGALIEIPDKAGFPATLGYITWSLSMLPCALIALKINKWKLDISPKAIILGSLVGLLGAGGQLILFEALRLGPAYIIFPFVSMSPVVTIILSLVFLKEKTTKRQRFGILIALLAILFLSIKPGDENVQGIWWIIMASLVFFMWGIQAYIMKSANKSMSAESIFIYMTITGLILAPVAYCMTDFNTEISFQPSLVCSAFLIQILNAAGALTLVYAYRYGNAVIVSPLTGLAPLITIVISLIIYAVLPGPILLTGLILASIGLFVLSE